VIRPEVHRIHVEFPEYMEIYGEIKGKLFISIRSPDGSSTDHLEGFV
jgi:hypothetical protein